MGYLYCIQLRGPGGKYVEPGGGGLEVVTCIELDAGLVGEDL